MTPRSPVLLAVLAVAVAGCKGEPAATKPAEALTASPDHVPPGTNAVQNEMRLLHEAMRDSVTAIADGHPSTIAESLQRVHGARELTEKAVEEGHYTLPKNAGKLEEFKAKDEAFHAELEKLAAASKANDAKAASEELGVVLSKCADCHTQFRR